MCMWSAHTQFIGLAKQRVKGLAATAVKGAGIARYSECAYKQHPVNRIFSLVGLDQQLTVFQLFAKSLQEVERFVQRKRLSHW